MLPEQAWQLHQLAIGAAVLTNRKALIEAERARVTAATEGGIGAADRRQRQPKIARDVLRLAARREMLIRATEAEGEWKPRPPIHPELSVFRQQALEEIAR